MPLGSDTVVLVCHRYALIVCVDCEIKTKFQLSCFVLEIIGSLRFRFEVSFDEVSRVSVFWFDLATKYSCVWE